MRDLIIRPRAAESRVFVPTGEIATFRIEAWLPLIRGNNSFGPTLAIPCWVPNEHIASANFGFLLGLGSRKMHLNGMTHYVVASTIENQNNLHSIGLFPSKANAFYLAFDRNAWDSKMHEVIVNPVVEAKKLLESHGYFVKTRSERKTDVDSVLTLHSAQVLLENADFRVIHEDQYKNLMKTKRLGTRIFAFEDALMAIHELYEKAKQEQESHNENNRVRRERKSETNTDSGSAEDSPRASSNEHKATPNAINGDNTGFFEVGELRKESEWTIRPTPAILSRSNHKSDENEESNVEKEPLTGEALMRRVQRYVARAFDF